LDDKVLGSSFMRVTTGLPEDNVRFIDALKELLPQ
jgi:histidinol-phosphate/aromatic aminotransferase/cobyric acid decarboxylase-like protein